MSNTRFISLTLFALIFPLSLLPARSQREENMKLLKKIGIAKIVAHPALDDLEKGLIEAISAEYPDAVFDRQNANGDPATAAAIAQKFKQDNVDMAIGIATPTAVALANGIKDIPVIFCAITDPVDAGLVPSLGKSAGNITGTSDMTPVYDQINLLDSLKPLDSLGHVYSSSEANAIRLAQFVEEAASKLDVNFVPSTVTSSAEVKKAAQSIAGRVDAFYVSTDNTVVSALSSLVDVANKAGIPVFSADPSSARENGVFMAWGFDHYKMGLTTGRLALEILNGASPASIPTRFMSVDDIELYVDLDIAEKLGIEVPENLVNRAKTVIKDGETIKN